MAYFSEEGKWNRKGYSIYYYARANARASGPCRKSARKQGSRRFSISGKGRKGKKVPVWLKKTWQAASAKCERFQIKIGMTEKKHGKSLHKTDRKKMLREPKNTGMADKKMAGSIRKM